VGRVLLRLAPTLVQRAHRAAELGDEAIAAGAKGILFPSTIAAPGVNLVLDVDRFDADDVIEVFDPSGALPKKQDSWR